MLQCNIEHNRAGNMAIGEFGGVPAAAVHNGPMTPAYWLYEMGHAALNPSRAFADAARLFYKNPANPLAHTAFGKGMAASMELFERSTRRYGRPEWNIDSVLSILHLLGGETHVLAVCQPSVPVIAAVARMEADGDPYVPYSMVLM